MLRTFLLRCTLSPHERYGRYDVDKYGMRFPTGYTVLIDNTVFFSETLASNDCVTRLSPVGCFYSLMPLTGGVVPGAVGTDGSGGGEGGAGEGLGSPQGPAPVLGTAGERGGGGGGDGGDGGGRSVLVPVLTAVLVGKWRLESAGGWWRHAAGCVARVCGVWRGRLAAGPVLVARGCGAGRMGGCTSGLGFALELLRYHCVDAAYEAPRGQCGMLLLLIHAHLVISVVVPACVPGRRLDGAGGGVGGGAVGAAAAGAAAGGRGPGGGRGRQAGGQVRGIMVRTVLVPGWARLSCF